MVGDGHIIMLLLAHLALHLGLGLLDPNLLSEPLNLGQDHLAHLGHIFYNFEGKVESVAAGGLIRGIVPDLQILVSEGLLDGDTRRGVEGEHLVEEIEGLRVGFGEELLEGAFGHVREVADVVLGTGRADAGEGFFVGGAEDVQDLVELVDVVTAFEEGTAAKEFGKDAANRPDIDYRAINQHQ